MKKVMFDAFSGYGGFTIAALLANINVIGLSEIDKYASAVLKFRFPNIINYGDINEIRASELPAFDILTGGTPCQNLSIAGDRQGLTGNESSLFFAFIKILKEKNPTYFVWENVKGALSSNKGWDFARVQIEMAQAGYNVEYGVVNSKWFVPHNRERVFVIGYLNRMPRGKIFPFVPQREGNYEVGKDISFCLDANYYKGISPRGYQSKRRQLVKDHGHLRRLTPIECERLMGIPDNWTEYGNFDGEIKPISDTQRYRMCGNGVVVPVVKEIFERMFI